MRSGGVRGAEFTSAAGIRINRLVTRHNKPDLVAVCLALCAGFVLVGPVINAAAGKRSRRGPTTRTVCETAGDKTLLANAKIRVFYKLARAEYRACRYDRAGSVLLGFDPPAADFVPPHAIAGWFAVIDQTDCTRFDGCTGEVNVIDVRTQAHTPRDHPTGDSGKPRVHHARHSTRLSRLGPRIVNERLRRLVVPRWRSRTHRRQRS